MLNLNFPIIIIFVILGLFFVWLGYLSFLFFKYTHEKRQVVRDLKSKGINEVLESYLERLNRVDQEIKGLQTKTGQLNHLAQLSITKVGLVRFNPFENTGGNQSFSIALLNFKNDGLVLTSLHGREGTRIYAKPIKEGKSEHHLTSEELEAISKAIEFK